MGEAQSGLDMAGDKPGGVNRAVGIRGLRYNHILKFSGHLLGIYILGWMKQGVPVKKGMKFCEQSSLKQPKISESIGFQALGLWRCPRWGHGGRPGAVGLGVYRGVGIF